MLVQNKYNKIKCRCWTTSKVANEHEKEWTDLIGEEEEDEDDDEEFIIFIYIYNKYI